jgi:hypothetical protein
MRRDETSTIEAKKVALAIAVSALPQGHSMLNPSIQEKNTSRIGRTSIVAS